MKGISFNYVEIIELVELMSDHIPVLLTASLNAIKKQLKVSLTKKKTNWDFFRANLDKMVNLFVSLRTPIEMASAIEQLTNNVIKAANLETPEIPARSNRENIYPMELKELAKKKRKAPYEGSTE